MNARETISRCVAVSSGYGIRLKTFWNTFWKILTVNLIEGVILPKKYLSVSVEKGSISVAYGARFLSKPQIKGFKKYVFDEGKYAGPENLASAVSLAIDEMKASGADVVLSIPREFVIVRHTELPAAVKENITSVMFYELDRLTPFTPAEAMYDFKVYDEDKGNIRVIVVAARTDVLRPYLDALKEKNIHPTRVTISAASLGTLCSAIVGGNDALCVSIDDEGYEGCLTKKGIVASIFYGSFVDNDREKNLERMAEEIAPFLDQLKDGCASSIVLFCPAEGYTMLERKIGVPVRVLKKNDIRSMFKTVGDDVICAPLGGLLEAIGPGARGFNLLSKGFKEVKRVPMVLAIVLSAIIIAMIIPYLLVPLQIEKRRLQEIDGQISSRKGEIKKIEALKSEISALSGEIYQIKEFKESRPMALNIMKELTTILPKTVWLTRARMTEEIVEIEGYAGVATEILTKLEQSNLFKKVEFTSPTIRDARMNLDRFVIKMEIEGFEKKPTGGEKNAKKE